MQEHRFYTDAMASYIILKCPASAREDYQYRMLAVNRICGLLPCKYRAIDGEEFLYYNITSRQSIARLYDHLPMGGKQMRRLLFSVAKMIQTLSTYLLDPDKLLLDPENIYYDYGQETYGFVYYPEEQRRQDYRALFEYLAERLEEGDEENRIVIYRLCELAEHDGFLFSTEVLDREYRQAVDLPEQEPEEKEVEGGFAGMPVYPSDRLRGRNVLQDAEDDESDGLFEDGSEQTGQKEQTRQKGSAKQTKQTKRLKRTKSTGRMEQMERIQRTQRTKRREGEQGSPILMLVLAIVLAGSGIGLYVLGVMYPLSSEELFAARIGMLSCLVLSIGTALYGMAAFWKRNRQEMEQEEGRQQEERRNAMIKTAEKISKPVT